MDEIRIVFIPKGDNKGMPFGPAQLWKDGVLDSAPYMYQLDALKLAEKYGVELEVEDV